MPAAALPNGAGSFLSLATATLLGAGSREAARSTSRPSFDERVEVVTFPPNFACEECAEAAAADREARRHVRCDLVPRDLKLICQKAIDQPELLIIDEINRANLAAVLAELITLVEEDERDKGRVTLPYSK